MSSRIFERQPQSAEAPSHLPPVERAMGPPRSNLDHLLDLAQTALLDGAALLDETLTLQSSHAGNFGNVQRGVDAVVREIAAEMWLRFGFLVALFSRRPNVDEETAPRAFKVEKTADLAREQEQLAQLSAEMDALAVRKRTAETRLTHFTAVEKKLEGQMEVFVQLRGPLDAASQLSVDMAPDGELSSALAKVLRDHKQILILLENFQDDSFKPMLASLKKERRVNSERRSALKKARLPLEEVDLNALRNLRIN